MHGPIVSVTEHICTVVSGLVHQAKSGHDSCCEFEDDKRTDQKRIRILRSACATKESKIDHRKTFFMNLVV